jgi:hypothetical protein
MAGYVALALDQGAGRGLFHRATTDPLAPSGDDLRSANGAGPRFVPSSGTSPRPTVATVQLTDWAPSDLTGYIAAARVNDPTLPSSVTLTHIDDSFDPAVFDPNDAVEVALDQEALFAVAPYAKQRVYTSGNSLGGMLDSMYAIGDDALSSSDDNIVAASISWGFCESELGGGSSAGQVAAALLDAVSYLNLLGVTVFAATGDDGTGCATVDPTTQARTLHANTVALPASVPGVVAVGGTSGGVPDPLQGDLTSWDDPDAPSTAANDPAGSGGGASQLYGRPDYQAGIASPTAGRQLPDIAALAGAPGFDVYTGGAWARFGGTSLASPVSAAALANAIGTRPWGLGNILSDLYAAAPGGFVDVTVQGDATSTPKGPAADTAVGYDNATGLGVPKWTTLVPSLAGVPHLTPTRRWTNQVIAGVTVQPSPGASGSARYRIADTQYGAADCSIIAGESSTPPTSYDLRGADPGQSVSSHYYDGDYTLAVLEHDGSACKVGYRTVTLDTRVPSLGRPLVRVYTGAGNSQLKATWVSSDSGSGIDHYSVTVRRYAPGSTTPVVVVNAVRVSSPAYVFPAAPGYGYVATVQSVDRAGNAIASSSAKTTTVDDSVFAYSGSWSKATSTGDFRGSSHYSGSTGRSAGRTATGRSYYLIVRTCASCGRATVTVGGLTRTIDLYSSTTRQRVSLLVYASSASATRSVVVKPLGTRNSRSHGTAVFVDGLTVLA